MEIPEDMTQKEFTEAITSPMVKVHPLHEEPGEYDDLLIITDNWGYSKDVHIVRRYKDSGDAECILKVEYHPDYEFDPRKLGRSIYRKVIASRKVQLH